MIFLQTLTLSWGEGKIPFINHYRIYKRNNRTGGYIAWREKALGIDKLDRRYIWSGRRWGWEDLAKLWSS